MTIPRLLVVVLTAALAWGAAAAPAAAAPCWGSEPPASASGGDDRPSGAGFAEVISDAPFEGTPADVITGFFCHWNTSDPADFTARIAWGDGSETAGTVVAAGGWATSSSSPGYQFVVRGTHAYRRTGRHDTVATIRHTATGTTRTLRGTQEVQNQVIEPLVPFPPVPTRLGVESAMRLGGFRDRNPLGEPADYSSTVTWADGTSDAGAITKEADGTLVVSATRAFTTPAGGIANVELRDRDGSSASTHVWVSGPPSPTGTAGVIINGGAPYTRSRDVTLNLGNWPVVARGAFISNDGAFGAASLVPVAAEVPWQLPDGPRPDRAVHVRYGGSPQTFTDSIVLDEAPPVLRRLSASRGPGSRTVDVRVDARDAISGVDRIEVGERRRGGRLLRPARRLRVRSARSALVVRARDRAGNVSAWRSVSVRRARR